jgi:hypothetical protein
MRFACVWSRPAVSHADDENDARPITDAEHRRFAEQRADLLRERAVEIADIAARLQPSHELGGRAHADVRTDQRLFQPLPRELVTGIEGRRRKLLR